MLEPPALGHDPHTTTEHLYERIRRRPDLTPLVHAGQCQKVTVADVGRFDRLGHGWRGVDLPRTDPRGQCGRADPVDAGLALRVLERESATLPAFRLERAAFLWA